MKFVARFFYSGLAILVALLIGTLPVLGATYTISETSSDFYGSSLTNVSVSNCNDGNAKATQQATYSTFTAVGSWYAYVGTRNWEAFICYNGGSLPAVRYHIIANTGENWYTTVNFENWLGYVYIGNFDNSNTSGRTQMTNQCVTGYACDSYRWIYYDWVRYSTW